jgi:hypothetical protein
MAAMADGSDFWQSFPHILYGLSFRRNNRKEHTQGFAVNTSAPQAVGTNFVRASCTADVGTYVQRSM